MRGAEEYGCEENLALEKTVSFRRDQAKFAVRDKYARKSYSTQQVDKVHLVTKAVALAVNHRRAGVLAKYPMLKMLISIASAVG